MSEGTKISVQAVVEALTLQRDRALAGEFSALAEAASLRAQIKLYQETKPVVKEPEEATPFKIVELRE